MIIQENIFLIISIGFIILIIGIVIGWIGGKHLRPTYSIIAFVGIFWFLYSIYTIEKGIQLNGTFDWVGAACIIQVLGLEIGLIGKTVSENISTGKEIYSNIKKGKK